MSVRTDPSDVDAFDVVFVAADGNVAIHVDLDDAEWSGETRLKLIGIGDDDQDVIAHAVVVVTAATILSDEVLVDAELSFLLKQMKVRNDGDVQYHIAMEDECSRGDIQSVVNGNS